MNTVAGFLIAYVICVVLFVGIDMAWLLGPGRPLYVSEMGDLMRTTPQLGAAIAFYFLYAAGLVFFAVWPASRTDIPAAALLLGIALGLVAYGTYDLTALAVIKGFTAKIALIDLAWGAILSGIVSWATLWLTRLFN